MAVCTHRMYMCGPLYTHARAHAVHAHGLTVLQHTRTQPVSAAWSDTHTHPPTHAHTHAAATNTPCPALHCHSTCAGVRRAPCVRVKAEDPATTTAAADNAATNSSNSNNSRAPRPIACLLMQQVASAGCPVLSPACSEASYSASTAPSCLEPWQEAS